MRIFETGGMTAAPSSKQRACAMVEIHGQSHVVAVYVRSKSSCWALLSVNPAVVLGQSHVVAKCRP